MDKVREAVGNAGQYLREVRGELRRVQWPDRMQTVRLTSVVIVASVLVSVLIWGFDNLVSSLMKLVLK